MSLLFSVFGSFSRDKASRLPTENLCAAQKIEEVSANISEMAMHPVSVHTMRYLVVICALTNLFAHVAQSATRSLTLTLHPDIVNIIPVKGATPGGGGWADSYSVGDKCYCDTTYDHNIGPIEVSTPFGVRTVRQVCEMIGAGPGSAGRPLYNDVQCGNGPPNDAGDEHDCPGRVDIGPAGCGQIGPKWDFSAQTRTSQPVSSTDTPTPQRTNTSSASKQSHFLARVVSVCIALLLL